MKSILNQIAARKIQEVHEAKHLYPLNSLANMPTLPLRDFTASIKQHNPAIIAEIKRASPSKGVIRSDFDVETIAKAYANNGACCLSVLTDIDFFQGDPRFLLMAKTACDLPVLRKDFIIDTYQIHESRALGADCILLIVAMLDDQQLHDFCQMAQELQMAVLVESHTQEELERALQLPTPLIGINNRSLHSFTTSIQTTIDLKQYVPDSKIVITESGIHHFQDIQLLQSHGVHTFLIGESLMQAEDIGKKLKAFLGE